MFSFKLSIGKMAFAGQDLYTNEAIAGLLPKDASRVDMEYLRYALSQVSYLALAGHAVKGKTLNSKTLPLLEVPLPRLEEQHRIVAQLESQLAAAERARQAAQAQLDALEAMPAALLREIFPRSPSAPLRRGWRWVTLGDVCEIVNGSTPKTSVPEYWDGDTCWVTPADLGQLNTPYIGESARYITQAGYDACSTTMVPIGTIVMSSRAPIGHLAIADVELCTNQGCKSFVPGPQIDSVFLYYSLRCAVDDIREMGSGATFAEISKGKLASFEVAIPSYHEQLRIVTEVQQRSQAQGRALLASRAQCATADALPAALLRLAFPA